MKTNDIVVGALYRHINHPHALYMGMRTHRTKEEKYLLIINGGDRYRGTPVMSPAHLRGHNSNFWNGFFLVSDEQVTTVKIEAVTA